MVDCKRPWDLGGCRDLAAWSAKPTTLSKRESLASSRPTQPHPLQMDAGPDRFGQQWEAVEGAKVMVSPAQGSERVLTHRGPLKAVGEVSLPPWAGRTVQPVSSCS
jgi:hypothetical protein